MTVSRVLIIAGSDSSGGAGIQADIKAVNAFGGYAATALTAVTAQNTLKVTQVLVLEPGLVIAQINAVLCDIGADAIKIGMIGSVATAHALADRLAPLTIPIVLDPVMTTTSGTNLTDSATVDALERLMMLATLITPNLPELAILSSDGGRALARRTGAAVLAKGGHGEGAMLMDRLLFSDGRETNWTDSRIDTRHTHGTGCTLASAIAVGLAGGARLEDAVASARAYVRSAILSAPGLGAGSGPLGHGSSHAAFPGAIEMG